MRSVWQFRICELSVLYRSERLVKKYKFSKAPRQTNVFSLFVGWFLRSVWQFRMCELSGRRAGREWQLTSFWARFEKRSWLACFPFFCVSIKCTPLGVKLKAEKNICKLFCCFYRFRSMLPSENKKIIFQRQSFPHKGANFSSLSLGASRQKNMDFWKLNAKLKFFLIFWLFFEKCMTVSHMRALSSLSLGASRQKI